ncbi:histidine kinase-dna gyrase b-and hsp90-like domain protein [Stylonychia lemnae]|uniref:Histidine kinase-dna gyrase b-and hsp90-like domain protein n=1 Tax=Stylonychia lemnae TaxID=5949 RepID=A0A078A0N6_STYLE|nr:histidine kinase-dna gyrase b-and hsp90-like domain protein [Stylonychia lemnae]|eukprot:CDW75766.1 histidine kinase-dna gyrase b-and hsp90-like domain protein [Stylonychia lemnae]
MLEAIFAYSLGCQKEYFWGQKYLQMQTWNHLALGFLQFKWQLLVRPRLIGKRNHYFLHFPGYYFYLCSITKLEKLKWLSILDNLPFFVVIYDKIQQKITYYNSEIRRTFNVTMRVREAFDSLFVQNIIIKGKREVKKAQCEKLQFPSFKNLVVDMVSQNSKPDVSLLQNQDLKFKEEQINIRTEVEEVMSVFKQQAQIKDVDLSYKVKDSVHQYIISDRNRLRQIMFILIYNAIKYTTQGFVHMKIYATKTIEESQEDLEKKSYLIIEIQDSGCGMKLDLTDKIFKFLHNIKQKQKVNQHGMGLGLTICGKIVKAWGGSIQCSSVFGEGTKFEIKIPIKQVQKNHLSSMRLLQLMLYRILLVDDDAFNLYSLEQLIISRGNFECDKVMNGQDAIKRIKEAKQNNEEPYRFIFMDLNMPVIDGMQTTTILRQLDETQEVDLSRTKIYMHSAIQHTVQDDKGIFDGILGKPIHFKELDKILNSISNQDQNFF